MACGGAEPDLDVEPSVSLSQDGDSRIVRHAFGTVEVPADPQRVAVGHPLLDLDPVLALGVEPIAGTVYDDRAFALPSYLADDVGDGFTPVGTPGSPDLEALAAAEPDVIVAAANDLGGIYEQLTEIAPVVAFPYEQPGWRAYLEAVGAALGRGSEAEAALAAYEQRVAEVAALVDDPAEVSVSVVRVRPDGVRAIRTNSFSGSILAEIGVDRPAGQLEVGDLPFEDLSLERAEELDADLLFLWGALEGADERREEVVASPLWQQLDVVRRDAVFEVPEEHWFVGGPSAAERVLDDVADAFETLP